MSSIHIVQDIHSLIQTHLIPAVPKKWQPQFQFGLRAYALQTFQSATSNARRVVVNPNTAARKSERLLANTRLANYLGKVFYTLRLVKPASYVNVDHSDMHGLTALVGAVQTRSGEPSHVLSKQPTLIIFRLSGVETRHHGRHGCVVLW